MVALNIGPAPQRVDLPAGRAYRLALATDEPVALAGSSLDLPPFAGAALLAGGAQGEAA